MYCGHIWPKKKSIVVIWDEVSMEEQTSGRLRNTTLLTFESPSFFPSMKPTLQETSSSINRFISFGVVTVLVTRGLFQWDERCQAPKLIRFGVSFGKENQLDRMEDFLSYCEFYAHNQALGNCKS